MNVLQILQQASDEIRLGSRPSTIVNNTSQDSRSLLRYLEKIAQDLISSEYDWTFLVNNKNYTAVAGEEQSALLPSDFYRFVPESFYDNDSKSLITGPVSFQEYSGLKASQRFQNALNRKFIQRSGSFFFYPFFNGGEQCGFNYVSTNWLTDASGINSKNSISFDTDIPKFDAELLILGVCAEYLYTRGIGAWEKLLADYRTRLQKMVEKDRPKFDVMSSGDIFSGQGSRHYTGIPIASGSGLYYGY